MHQVQRPPSPAAPKQIYCSSTGMTYTFKAEGMWGNGLIYATIRHYSGAEPELKFKPAEHVLNITLGGASDWTRVKVSGSPLYEGHHRAGCVTYTPPHTERQAWHRNFNLDRLHLLIDPSFLRSFEFARDPSGVSSLINARDPLLESVLWAMAGELRDFGAELPPVYVEHAAGLLMAHLVHSAGRGHSRHPSRVGLSEAHLRRVIEFIEDNLGQDISLTALAALTGTGVDVFARNFKASMGVPPYRYVLERRLFRAQMLLMDGGKSLAEIAFEVGFSSQAHFTARFSKVTGVSPAAYRARHRR
jgi:AraC family transcriptional regulator